MFLNTQNKNSFDKKMFSILFFLFIFFVTFNSLKISHAAPATDPTYEDTVKYPRIELKVNASLAADKEKLFITSLKNHKCLDSSYNIDTAVVTNTSLNAINSFRKVNGITQEKNVGIYTWEALMLKAGEKTKSGDLVFDCGDKTVNGGSLGGAVQTYQNISSFSGEATSTTFTNTNTGGLGDAFNYILTLMAVAIIVLVAFRIIEGAITKGAFENIYDQQKGKKLMETAGKALLIFILAYAVLSFINPDLTGWTFIQSVTGLGSTGSSNNGDCGSIAGYTKTDIESMLLQDEGSKTTAYYDTKGIPTIGVGYNLIRNNNVKQELIAAGVDEANASKLASLTKDPSKAGKQVPGYTITPDQVKKLLEKDLGTFTAIAKRVSEKNGINFESLPLNVKNVLIDMSYAGEGTFDDFKNMLKFVKEGNYVKAAGQIKYSDLEETKISPYCNQTGDRCGRLVGLMAGQCKSSIQTNNNQQSLANQNSEKSVCSKLSSVDETKMVDIRTYLKGSVTCSEDGGNPKKCMVNKDVADKLKKLDDIYFAKYSKHLDVISAYRDDNYQGQNCKNGYWNGTSNKCYNSCGNGGPNGSNHSLGNAVDLNTSLIGCQKSASSCSDPRWKLIIDSRQTTGLSNNYARGEFGHLSDTGW